ncbi:MAG TPA: geranylgeranylglyceryl/heptaprenylglyceryl phosphate synthase [Flavobacterium sp.]|jgi:putative glycerol-1-phosphate prenyltransferase
MKNIYSQILEAKANNQKLLAILIDPDKTRPDQVPALAQKITDSPATHIFIGGSTFNGNNLDEIVIAFKENSNLPVVLFPGHPSQISRHADGILFLTLLSGRNPDFLIGHQVDAIPALLQTHLEIMATGYILIESGTTTAVARMSQTTPLDRNNPEYVVQTALAGEMLGNKLIYLEAGSGARLSVPLEMITLARQNLTVPLIVGGGIRSTEQIWEAFHAGADIVVIGTAFENDNTFFE